MSLDVLNPALYGGLVRRYGEESVEIVSPGEAIEWHLRDARIGESPGRKRVVTHSGEEYRLRCPICRDHRARLYISHRFGKRDEATGSDNLWLAQCFNESCFSDRDYGELLFDNVYSISRDQSHTLRIGEGKKPSGVVREMSPPGPMWRLDELAKSHPNHHAIAYLESRHIDPVKVGRLWGASYCPKAHVYNLASDRIIIPVNHKGRMVGWQARYIGDNVRGVPFNIAGVPKYWTSPGFKKSRVAYNFERAVEHPTVVIVEGMTDVWSMGVQAMGVFGKSMSPAIQKDLLLEMAARHPPRDAVIVVLLDPKKDKKDKIHHIEKLCSQLDAQGAPVQVLGVHLPMEADPGSSDRKWLRAYIREKAQGTDIPISFRKPA